MIGTLPGTFVYANAGSNLASINSLKDIASPQVLGLSFFLGCLPWCRLFIKTQAAKKTIFSCLKVF